MGETAFVDIDHLMVSVADSEEAGVLFERMGFTATPRSQMPGLSNRLISFPQLRHGAANFIELMALDDAEKAIPLMPAILRPAGRPVSMVLSSADAEASARALRGRGYAAEGPVPIQRDWVLPSGETIRPSFAVVIPRPGQSPFYWNLCQYRTIEHYLRPDFTSRANGVSRMTAIIAVADDPEAVAAHYVDVWGAGRDDGRPIALRIGAVALRILTPDEAEAEFPGAALAGGGDRLVGFAVAHPQPADFAGRLRQSGFAPREAGGRTWLPPDQAAGCLMVVEAG
ncbi:VOC family protein [Marinibaculum pumilum]|uniref:VOC family protein n=1 Tax=Marinibaculum pumilum TaxID=1766165 RepID=A0ABV7L8U4_9PROT